MNYADLFRVTLPETVLEIAALLVLILDLGVVRRARLQLRLAVAAIVGIAGCGIAVWSMSMQGTAGLTYGPDSDLMVLGVGGYVAAAQVGILVLTALTLLLLIDAVFTRHAGEYVAVVLMSAAGGLLIAAAQDLLVIFIGLELLSLGLYILTAFAKASSKSAEAGMKYYLFGGMSAAFLLFGFSFLYGITGSTNLHVILLQLHQGELYQATPLLDIAVVLIVTGLGFKVAAVPFHLWAPDTYEGAPAPAAAFIASVSKVASFALLIGIATAAVHVFDSYGTTGTYTGMAVQPAAQGAANEPLHLGFGGPWMVLLVTLATASMVLGNLAALAQISVRRLLAYSAIAHAGYMLTAVAFFSYSPLSTNAILYYILTYGLTTIGAFGVVSVVERATGSDRLDAFLGLHKRNPVLAGVLLVLFLSLAGIPPLVGFWAKFNLFAAVLKVGAGVVPFTLVALAIALSAVSLYYYLQVLKRAYVMPAVNETPIKAHPVTMIVLVAIAAAVVLLGCLPTVLQNWIAGF